MRNYFLLASLVLVLALYINNGDGKATEIKVAERNYVKKDMTEENVVDSVGDPVAVNDSKEVDKADVDDANANDASKQKEERRDMTEELEDLAIRRRSKSDSSANPVSDADSDDARFYSV